ncbi:metal ABC transporter substrate-binding protein [Tumebacillus flagellatus]|uniref:Zinc ABC transporter substrate-binding protein n=1 Tax=Tumebacillus flagellatus TaxID=1157490 RepID=A0A074LMW9_9BACL|nr:metal ABC transporter substrate-binding protein [Tumebacillus flagellatus]KEO81178.1 hypothetical protein EL26_22235 [Tumebacillus flagellatus]
MPTWKKTSSLLALAVILTTATGCGSASKLVPKSDAATTSAASSATGSEDRKLQIVTTFYPMYDFAKQIAGDQADVTLLIPSNVEPHDWEPTPQDLIKIQKADVFIYNGAGLEGWVDKTLQSLNLNHLKIVEASKGLPLLEGEFEEEGSSAHPGEAQLDPHVWLDPVLAEQQVSTIEKALAEVDPAHAAAYQASGEAYQQRLQNLDKSYRAVTSTAPRKEFVTSHAAFGYLAKRYGLQQIPISGLNPEVEPTTAQVADVVKLAKSHATPVIYFESLVSPKVAERVAQEIGCTTEVLDPLEGLSDEEQAQHLDYVSVMERNLEALKKSLLVPAK